MHRMHAHFLLPSSQVWTACLEGLKQAHPVSRNLTHFQVANIRCFAMSSDLFIICTTHCPTGAKRLDQASYLAWQDKPVIVYCAF